MITVLIVSEQKLIACISPYPPAWFTLATSSLNSERIDYLLHLLVIMIARLKNEVNSLIEKIFVTDQHRLRGGF